MPPKREETTRLEDMMQMMRVSTAYRELRQDVQKELNRAEIQADLRQRILAAAEISGEKLTAEDVDAAILDHFDDKYIFHEPEHNFSHTLAKAYINRGKISAIVLTPILTLAAIAGIGWGAYTLGTAVYRKNQESSVESNITHACDDISKTRLGLESLASLPLSSGKLIDARQIYLSGAQASLRETDSFRDEFCSSDISRLVTGSNYNAFKQRLDPIEAAISGANISLQNGLVIVDIEKTYESVLAVAIEQQAVTRADDLYQQAVSYATAQNLDRMKEVSGELHSLDAVLRDDYTVTIVSREGEKSGIDRYYTDESGKRVSGFYLIVEAIGTDGKPQP
ncbi:MAG: DUF6384 family protein, partial [Nanoarchaeota archaeon]